MTEIGIAKRKRKKKKKQRWPLRLVIFVVCCFSILFVLESTQVDDGHYEPQHSLQAHKSKTAAGTSGGAGPGPGAKREHEFPDPARMLGEEAVLKITPLYGEHRPDSDAVFGFASGLRMEHLLRFVGTLLDTGYDGDIVLGVNKAHELDPDMKRFLEYHSKHSHLIAYPAELVCKKIKTRTRCKAYKLFLHKSIGGYLPDPRHYREVTQIRFDYYWAWSTQYSDKSRIFLLDTKDTFFQTNPFKGISGDNKFTNSLMTFQESPLKTIADEIENRLWQQEEKHDIKWVRRLGRKNILIASAVVGGQPAIETYCRAMIEDNDVTDCQMVQCEQASHNYLFWSGTLKKSEHINELIMAEQGKSVVNTLRNLVKYGGSTLREIGIINGKKQVVNVDGKLSPVVHQYEEDVDLKGIVDVLTGKQQEKWRQISRRLENEAQ